MTRTLVTAIVSTAAVGAERGALDAAIELGLGHGGWAADPELPAIYAAHAKPTRDRGLAVRLNVQDGDGTLIVSFADALSGRTRHAGDLARQQRKPAKHLVLPAGDRTRIPDAVRAALLDWIDEERISVLHVVGPGEEHEPGIGQATHDALVWVLEDEVVEPVVVDGAWPGAIAPWQPLWSQFAGVDRSAAAVESLQHVAAPTPLDAALVAEAGRRMARAERTPTSACAHCGCTTPRAPGELCQCGHPPGSLPVHLWRDDTSASTWCDAADPGSGHDDPSKVTCQRCLYAASGYGDRAHDAIKPYRSGPLQQTHRIPALRPRLGDAAALGSWTLRLYSKLDEEQRTHWVGFELFEVAGLEGTERTPGYPRRGATSGMDLTTSLDEAEPAAHGFVKWDGCTQFSVAPVHVDSREDLEGLFHGISEARRLCAAAMPSTYDRSSEYP